MDQAQSKALIAIQPFVHLATTQKSPTPRFIADLINRAISAPGTYIFTELLQTPAVQALKGTDSDPWVTLLEIFSWGTLDEYQATSNLPPLDAAQTYKLRQLTLLTLASPFAPVNDTNATHHLTYASLMSSLSLSSPSELESLVTQSIYSGLLTARLSPTSYPPVVRVTSVAALRDLRPQSLPALLQILETWESRCVSQVADLQSQLETIRMIASRRTTLQNRRQAEIDTAVLSDKVDGAAEKAVRQLRNLTTGQGQRSGNKRDLDQQLEGDDEAASDEDGRMDLDEGVSDVGGGSTVGVRGGSGNGSGGGGRGAKRNRARGK
ncbi:hypothetical protein B0A52_06670 [Exophiala mesophila]|uniref:PCI domain-containing protein n=1 Tax=Exophiala mesophila TaxID=212818 RepID=A0A438N1P9_EXOME|nr:hypothetical protein B0A52_06670 [Exophiala mesophila]